jgi:hypothetical protein
VISAFDGDTTTLYSASLTLYEGGTATITQRLRQVHLTLPPREATDIAHYSYRIIGDSLVLDQTCGISALCAGPPFGKFTSGTTMTLFYYDYINIGHLIPYFYSGSSLD